MMLLRRAASPSPTFTRFQQMLETQKWVIPTYGGGGNVSSGGPSGVRPAFSCIDQDLRQRFSICTYHGNAVNQPLPNLWAATRLAWTGSKSGVIWHIAVIQSRETTNYYQSSRSETQADEMNCVPGCQGKQKAFICTFTHTNSANGSGFQSFSLQEARWGHAPCSSRLLVLSRDRALLPRWYNLVVNILEFL